MKQRTIFLKVNYCKITETKKFESQVFKVSEYLADRYNFNKSKTTFKIGLAGVDFVKNKVTLKIILKR